ncbi:MAG: cyclic nucleotide-binding domain-containing protein [Candidatus Pacebacteria bacterium]|nr:cyclic nucleotide-binding domain-containing protein [Candidatus Paceibacterota bacterium]
MVYRENSNPDALLLNRSLSNSSNTPAHDESIVVYPREHRAGDGNTTQCFLRPDMRCYYMVYLANLANVFVTAIITPFHVAYYQDFSPVLAAIDTLCIIESAFNMLVRFRTAVLLRDPVYSYSMRDIWKAYNGSEFVIDLFGLSPFNLIFSCAGVQHPLYIIVPLRLLRTLIIANAFSVVSHIQLLNYRMSSTVYFLSIVSSFIFLMNYTSAMWYLISSQVEKDTAVTWEKYNNLVSASIVDKMVFSIYYTTKIVSGVGSGDSFAATNLERLVTCLIVHLGDVVFAVTFGLIAALTSTWSDETESYLLQKARIEEFAEAFKLSQSHKERVRRYYDYIQSMEYTPTIYQQARELLPPPLAKEIAYETNKHLLLPVFHDISCLNFIKQVSYNIDTEHFLPGDYVMHKGDIGEEIYFIAEGRVALVAPDKRTVYCRLENGAYFGEIALFVTCKRAYYAQAETHCCICVLKRRVMEELMKNFPAVARKIRERGEQRLRQIKERDAKFGEPEEEKDHSFASAEDCKGLIEEKEQEDSQPNGDRDEERKASPVQRKLRRRSFAHLPRSLFKNKTKSKQHVMMTPALKPAKEREVMVEDSLDSMAPLPQPDTVPKRKATNKCGPLRRRLSQLNFGKHFALSGETQIEMQWTVLKSPEDASEKR